MALRSSSISIACANWLLTARLLSGSFFLRRHVLRRHVLRGHVLRGHVLRGHVLRGHVLRGHDVRGFGLCGLAVCWLLVTQYSRASAQEAKIEPLAENPFVTDEVDAAIDRGVQYLLSKQRPDGAIAERQYETTMSSLAIMALASTGVTPASSDERGLACRRALDFVLKEDRQDREGYFGSKDGSRMYGHGITTLMLTEMLGMGADDDQDALIHSKCQKAIDLILSAQKFRKHTRSHQGGWRYTPNSEDSDLSVSVWQLMALRSAKNDGLAVPASAIEEAIGYLQRSFTAPLRGNNPPADGGFSYLPEQNQPTFAMTAAGLLAMQVCGQYESPMTVTAAEWLLKHPPKPNERFLFYGTYYFSQGMYQRGGDHAQQAQQLVRDMVLPKQLADGSWEANSGEEQSAGKIYATCMSILSLSVKHHYLPIYQR